MFRSNCDEYTIVGSACFVEQLRWYSNPSKRDTSSTLSQAELQQLALNSGYYGPLGAYPSYPSTGGDVTASSHVVDYSSVSNASALAPVASTLESQASSATYTTPLGMTSHLTIYICIINSVMLSKLYESCDIRFCVKIKRFRDL